MEPSLHPSQWVAPMGPAVSRGAHDVEAQLPTMTRQGGENRSRSPRGRAMMAGLSRVLSETGIGDFPPRLRIEMIMFQRAQLEKRWREMDSHLSSLIRDAENELFVARRNARPRPSRIVSPIGIAGGGPMGSSLSPNPSTTTPVTPETLV